MFIMIKIGVPAVMAGYAFLTLFRSHTAVANELKCQVGQLASNVVLHGMTYTISTFYTYKLRQSPANLAGGSAGGQSLACPKLTRWASSGIEAGEGGGVLSMTDTGL